MSISEDMMDATEKADREYAEYRKEKADAAKKAEHDLLIARVAHVEAHCQRLERTIAVLESRVAVMSLHTTKFG